MSKSAYDIDIYTDAGYSIKGKIGAYAFCVKSEKLLAMKSGVFREMPRHSSEAEAWCILNALDFTVKHAKFKVNKIRVYTDSMACVYSLNKKQPDKNEEGRFGYVAKMLFINFIKANNIHYPIDVIHVKGHQEELNTEEARLNDWCHKATNEAKKGNIINFYAKK